MSVLTANTLFHFTMGKDALMNILETGFRPSYCDEFGDALNNVLKPVKIPMVCFCDLPMSKLQKHMRGHNWEYEGKNYDSKGYGNYGLGMTKSWGNLNRLNPVTYVNPNSYLLESAGITSNELNELYIEFKDKWFAELSNGPVVASGSFTVDGSTPFDPRFFGMPDGLKKYEKTLMAFSNALSVFSYMKPYQDSKTGQIYYDEREWRYTVPYARQYGSDVPVLGLTPKGTYIPLFGDPNETYNEEKFKKVIIERYMLKFKAEDTKYIIVASFTDALEVKDRLIELEAKGKYTREEVDFLSTKILTSSQINEDF